MHNSEIGRDGHLK